MVDTEPHGGRNGVSRRRFVKAAGASGIAVGLAGCTGGGGGGDGGGGDGGGGDGGGGDGGSGAEKIDMSEPSEELTIQWAADSNFQNAADKIRQTLYDNGLSQKIKIEFLGGSFVTDDRRTKYKNILEAGQKKPEILMVDNGWTIPFIARGQLLNLSQAMPKNHMDQVSNTFLESMLNTARDDQGNIYGQPLFADFPTMQYRKDWVEQAGYDPEGEGWATKPLTWKKFSNVTKDVMESVDKDVDGFSFQGAAYEGLSCCDFNEFMSSWGGAYFGGRDNLFGPVGDRPITVDEKRVLDSIRMIRTFIHGSGDSASLSGYAGSIAPQAVVQWQEEPSRGPFSNGNVVMHRNWPYSININGAQDKFGEDLGVMPLPYAAEEGAKYEGVGGSTAALGGWHLALNPNAEDAHMSAAAQVLTTLAKEQVQLDMFEIGGWIPPVPDRIANDRTKQLDVIGRYVDTLAFAAETAMPRPATVVWPQESQQIAKEVNAAFRQQKTPQKAMSDLKASIEQIESSA